MISSIPAVLSALTSAWASALPGFDVVRGPIYDSTAANLLAVGWDRMDQPSVSASMDLEDIELSSGQETVLVSCLLTVFVGSGTLDDALTVLFDGFAACRSAVVADPSLGGVVSDAEVGTDYDFTPAITDTGAELVDLRFTVTAHAFI